MRYLVIIFCQLIGSLSVFQIANILRSKYLNLVIKVITISTGYGTALAKTFFGSRPERALN